MKFIAVYFAICFLANVVIAFKRTVIVHGIMFNTTDKMQGLKAAIRAFTSQEDNEVMVLDELFNQGSFLPMWYQVVRFQRSLVTYVGTNREGINLIGYSQGGLIARALIETTPNVTIDSFISISSPQNGFHGEFFTPKSNFSVGFEERFADSVSGFWKDPRDMLRYKREGRFLAALNNDIKHRLNTQFKQTMCRVKHVVLIGGPDDGVVVPWQSALFGYDNQQGRVTDMKEQEIYKRDSFCLRTLDNRGAITRYTVPNIKHADWHNTPSVVSNYILPHLV